MENAPCGEQTNCGRANETVADMMKSLAEEINNRAGFKENLEKILFYAIRKISSETERVIVEEGETGRISRLLYL